MVQSGSPQRKVQLFSQTIRLKKLASKWKRGQINNQSLQTIQEGLASLENACKPQSNKIIFNVGGVRFETYRSTLRNIPDTRLTWMTETKSDNPHYDPITGEYFFDRHPNMFLMILNYYRTGKLHIPADVCGPAFEAELAFWGIDEKQIESCCWGSYSKHRDAQQTLDELRLHTDSIDDFDSIAASPSNNFVDKIGVSDDSPKTLTGYEKWQPTIWSVLNDHTSSTLAKIFLSISMVLTVTVIVTFILETHPCCRQWRNESHLPKEAYTLKEYRENTEPFPILFYIEMVCMLELTVEFIARIVFCPSKANFFKNVLNWFDLGSLASFYVTIALFFSGFDFYHHFNLPVQIMRTVRVFRIFNMAKHLKGLRILFHTLKASASELLLMLILIFSLTTVFAAMVYIAEQVQEEDDNNIKTIPHGIWWAVVTMTTLGYGDLVPRTAFGYVIGTFCAISGVLFIALPIPIIVSNFSIYYSHAQTQEKLPRKRVNALINAANILKQDASDSPDITPNVDLTSQEDLRTPSDSKNGNCAILKDTLSNSQTVTLNEPKGIKVHFTEDKNNSSKTELPPDRVSSSFKPEDFLDVYLSKSSDKRGGLDFQGTVGRLMKRRSTILPNIVDDPTGL